MLVKLHIFGASGAGVTTLGEYLAEKWKINYYDSDYFFWEKTDPPFTVRRAPEERNAMIQKELAQAEGWVLGGSIIKWELDQAFDLAVFLWLPPEIRLHRLRKREYERYGELIYTDETRKAQHDEFIDWCAGYDTNTARGRTLEAHENWMQTLTCPLLRLEGDLTVEERAGRIEKKLSMLGIVS